MMKHFFYIKARGKSIQYALRGLWFVLSTQPNAKIHLITSILMIIFASILQLHLSDWCWLTCSIALVWFAETINTAFEFLCDVVSPEYHHAVEKAKDIAAGAVLICAVCAAALGLMIFLPYLN